MMPYFFIDGFFHIHSSSKCVANSKSIKIVEITKAFFNACFYRSVFLLEISINYRYVCISVYASAVHTYQQRINYTVAYISQSIKYYYSIFGSGCEKC